MARQKLATADQPILPPPERGQHDPVEFVDVRDSKGWPVRVHRTVDTLGRLLRNKTIRPTEAKAGNRFRAEFHRAKLDPARAPDICRIPSHGKRGDSSNKVEDAKEGVWLAMVALGGISSPAGSAVWFIIGADYTVREWAQRQSFGNGVSLRHEVATGILVGALGALAAHYGAIDGTS